MSSNNPPILNPIVDEPVPTLTRWGDAELSRLTETVKQNSLFYWKGPQTEALYTEFRKHYPLKHVFPTSSGTASLHVAIAALRLKPGDEIILAPITDMGSMMEFFISSSCQFLPTSTRALTISIPNRCAKRLQLRPKRSCPSTSQAIPAI